MPSAVATACPGVAAAKSDSPFADTPSRITPEIVTLLVTGSVVAVASVMVRKRRPERFKGKEEDKLLADFQQALGQANARLLAEAAGRPELHGMCTTLTLA